MNNEAGKQQSSKPGVAQVVTTGALVASAGLAAYGVLGIYGIDTPLAALGSTAFAGIVVLSEVGASRLLVYAQNAIEAGRRIGAAAIVGGFALLTVCNVAAGHLGLAALDGAITASKAAPLVAAHAKAKAEWEAADEALKAFDERESAKATNLAVGLRGAMERGIVSASVKALNGADAKQAEAEADAKREQKQAAKAEKKAALDRAEKALQSAPQGQPPLVLWAFACMLELLKGAFQWFAALGVRKVADQPAPQRQGVESVLDLTALDFADLPAEARREYASKLRSLAASLQHMKPKLAIVG